MSAPVVFRFVRASAPGAVRAEVTVSSPAGYATYDTSGGFTPRHGLDVRTCHALTLDQCGAVARTAQLTGDDGYARTLELP